MADILLGMSRFLKSQIASNLCGQIVRDSYWLKEVELEGQNLTNRGYIISVAIKNMPKYLVIKSEGIGGLKINYIG